MLRFGTLDLQNRVTQNDVKLRVNNSKAFTEILLSSYLHDFVKHYTSLWVTNSKVEPLFFHFRVINSKLKNKKLLYDHEITQHMYCVMLLCFLIKTHQLISLLLACLVVNKYEMVNRGQINKGEVDVFVKCLKLVLMQLF